MGELLLELFSEEIPARMQRRAADDLGRLVCERLEKTGLSFGETQVFATPRRLTLVIDGLADRSPDVSEERKGPRVGAPDKALEGFLRAAGLASIDDAEIVSDAKKGDYYLARIERPGRGAGEAIAEIVPEIIRQFPWPKSQRWGAGRLKWVRPLHTILCLLDGNAVPLEIDGIASGNQTRGHRFLAPDPISVTGFDDYVAKLKQAFVELDSHKRERSILDQAAEISAAANVAFVEDHALAVENAGLTEWPTVLMGTFDEAFLEVPGEVLTTAMKSHQKCFSLADNASGKLVNRFLLVTNLVADDGGKAIIAGNERVIRARLSDAKFFWDQDRKQPLESRLSELGGIIFHEKLGSQTERVERLRQLARTIAPIIGADPGQAERAATLCKADLVTDMVGEFPDLQGLIGRYYALDQGEDTAIAAAVEEHYKPQGPQDAIPSEPVAIAVALADKLDTLLGFWAIDEKPTGSKDPYALRRAALGIIRILLENKVRVSLAEPLQSGLAAYRAQRGADFGQDFDVGSFHAFFADRLKVYLRDRGARHDLIDAVFAIGAQDDLVMLVKRVEALGAFLDTDDGANLLAGVKRARNILRIEEKKDKRAYEGEPDASLFEQDQERVLDAAIAEAVSASANAVGSEDFATAMAEIARLRAPVDDFFDHVTVNADDEKLRENRLLLLNRIRAATREVAEFAKIEG